MKRRVGKFAFLLLLFAIAPTRALSEQIGDWRLEVDPMTEMVTRFRTDVEAAHAPIILEAASFVLKYDGSALPSETAKRATIARWSRVVLDALKLSGLRAMDGPGVTAQQRQQIGDLRQKLIERMPFGLRAQTRNQIGEITLLFDDVTAPCTRIDGAYAAFVMTIKPEVGVASDYGSLAVLPSGWDRAASAAAMPNGG